MRGGADLCLGAAGQLRRLLEEFPVLRRRLVALFALGNLDFAFALVSFSPWCVGCCLWSTAYGFFGTRALLGSTVDTCSTGGFGQISAFSTLWCNPILRRSFSIRLEWRTVPQSMLPVAGSSQRRFARRNLDVISTSSSILGSLRRFFAAQCSWSPR